MNLKQKFSLWIFSLVAIVVIGAGAVSFMSERQLLRDEPRFLGAGGVLSEPELSRFVNQRLHQALQRFALITWAALTIGFLGATWLSETMVDPIRRIVQGAQEISKGRLQVLALPERSDELGWMGRELNATVDKLREAEDMRRNFFSRITHELRTPLAAVEGFISMFLDGLYGDLSPQQRDPLLAMLNHANRLNRMVDDLLTAAQLDERKDVLHCARTRVDTLVENAAKLYLPLSRERGVALKVDCPAKPIVAWLDPEKILHVLTNLIANAFKFTAQGTVTMRVQEDLRYVTITVEDTGVGIPPAERENLFRRFYRSPSAKDVKGTGLGLFIVKSLVEAHGGEISVASGPGGGSRFTFALPKEPAAPTEFK